MNGSREDYDVAIVGSGIAGACAALALAQRGAAVMLLEAGSLPRHKVCGEFLSPESRATWRRLGVEDALLDAGALPVHTARIVTPGGVTLAVALPAGGLALSRFQLDEILWRQAALAGVRCAEHNRVRSVTGDIKDGYLVATDTAAWRARAVAVASGRASGWLERHGASEQARKNAPRHFGFKAHFRGVNLEPGVVELQVWPGGYCGLLRVEGGVTNVCLVARYEVMERAAVRTPGDLWAWLQRLSPPLARRCGKAERVTDWSATGNVTFDSRQPVTGDILRLGDAAGFIHPLTGDGMAMAARSGELAGATLGAARRGGLPWADTASLYAAAWRREFAPRLAWAGWMEPLLTSEWLAAPALGLANRWPALGEAAMKLTRGR